MCTQYRDLFTALAATFAAAEVKSRSQAGRQMRYVTARTVMNRLDAVVGPENWWDDFTPLEKSVICRLTIRLPDGQVLTKCDAGGYAGMADAGDDDKSGFSDAFKRTAVKFGVGRYLYQDGVANLVGAPERIIAGTDASASNVGVGTAAIVPTEAPQQPKPPVTKIQTGRDLYQFAEARKITAWVVDHFTPLHFPAKITTWTPAQVAKALPEIRTYLQRKRSDGKERAA